MFDNGTLVGRIDNVLYINLTGPRVILRVPYDKLMELKFYEITEFSDIYFIEMAVYGESQYPAMEPMTVADHKAIEERGA